MGPCGWQRLYCGKKSTQGSADDEWRSGEWRDPEMGKSIVSSVCMKQHFNKNKNISSRQIMADVEF